MLRGLERRLTMISLHYLRLSLVGTSRVHMSGQRTSHSSIRPVCVRAMAPLALMVPKDRVPI